LLLAMFWLGALAGIEPALLAELDFESSHRYNKRLILKGIFPKIVHMCKRVCKFSRSLSHPAGAAYVRPSRPSSSDPKMVSAIGAGPSSSITSSPLGRARHSRSPVFDAHANCKNRRLETHAQALSETNQIEDVENFRSMATDPEPIGRK
jgi:hypothetical protein